jgi:hypothetical protein
MLLALCILLRPGRHSGMIAWVLICSLCGAFGVLSAKGIGVALTDTFSGTRRFGADFNTIFPATRPTGHEEFSRMHRLAGGRNEFLRPWLYGFLLIVGVCVPTQIHFLNKSLEQHGTGKVRNSPWVGGQYVSRYLIPLQFGVSNKPCTLSVLYPTAPTPIQYAGCPCVLCTVHAVCGDEQRSPVPRIRGHDGWSHSYAGGGDCPPFHGCLAGEGTVIVYAVFK